MKRLFLRPTPIVRSLAQLREFQLVYGFWAPMVVELPVFAELSAVQSDDEEIRAAIRRRVQRAAVGAEVELRTSDAEFRRRRLRALSR